MKAAVKLKTTAFIVLVAWSITSFAQVNTMYVMKNGVVVFQSPVSDVDNMTFDEIILGDALIVHKNDGSTTDKVLLSKIQQFPFSDESFSIETSSGSEVYAFSDITKLLFYNIGATGVSNPSEQSGFDALISVTPTGDLMVKSSTAIKSLILFNVDGKIISIQQYSGVETQHIISLRDNTVGIYLLRVETEQGTIVKKLLNH